MAVQRLHAHRILFLLALITIFTGHLYELTPFFFQVLMHEFGCLTSR